MIRPLLRILALTPALLLNLAHAGWEIDPSHTHVSFQVSHLGISNTPGIFRKVSAAMNYDDANVENSSVRFSIEVPSIDTVNEQRDADLRGPDWFDAAKHPEITYSSTAVRRLDEPNFVISGLLTIRAAHDPGCHSAGGLPGRADEPHNQPVPEDPHDRVRGQRTRQAQQLRAETVSSRHRG